MAETPPPPMELKDFFSAAEARTDRWRQLAAVGRSWEASVARGQSDERDCVEAGRLLSELAALEDYWAYPGSRLMATVGEALKERNAGLFARLVQKISAALLTGAYRHDAGPWDPLRGARGARRGDPAPGRPSRRSGQALLRGARRHAERSARVGARAQRAAAPAASGGPVRLRDRPGRQLRGRGHRDRLQHQRAGRGDLRRLPVPLAPRPAGAARVPRAPPHRRRVRPSRPGPSPRRSPRRSRASGPSSTSTS